MKNNIIKKYKVDTGSKIFFFFFALFFLTGTIFTFNDFSLLIRTLFVVVVFSSLYGFLWMLRNEILITDNSIIIKFIVFPFQIKSEEVLFSEIKRIYNFSLLFTDQTVLFLEYGLEKKKTAFLMVGLGLPWEVIRDIVFRLPSSAQIDLEPFVWNRIKTKSVSTKKLILLAIFLILLVLLVAWYFWPRN